MSEDAVAEDRHASWLELFFDLVAVAGIGALAHLLGSDQSSGGIAVYVIAFTAIWMIWACFTVYGNIAGDRAHVLLILSAMFVLGVMIAAVPEIRGEHANAFAIAYVVGRFLAGRPWGHTTVVVDLPVVQTGAGIVPWIVSLWFEGTAQYTLWAVGLAIDLLFLVSSRRDHLLHETQARLDRVRAGRRPRGTVPTGGARSGRSERLPSQVEAADVDVPHLGERLGLFVLIVIGEGVVQIIHGASHAHAWDRQLAVTGAGAFALMYGFWAMAVRLGYAGVALLPDQGLPPRFCWPAHWLSALGIASVAAVLGGLVEEPRADVDEHVRWVLVCAYAGYALLCAAIHLARRDARAAVSLLPMGVAALIVAIATDLAAEGVTWVLAAGALVTIGVHARQHPDAW